MKSRITLDWDFKDSYLQMYFYNKIIAFNPSKIEMKKSRKGMHVFIWFNRRITEQNKFLIREICGDDKKHIHMDRTHKHARQTMFDSKRKIKMIKRNGVIQAR